MTQIEQLQARIAELEAENARLKDKQWELIGEKAPVLVNARTRLATAQEESKDFAARQKAQIELIQKQAGEKRELREQLATAEQRVADACADLCSEFGYAECASKAIRSGEWKKFRKGE